VEGRLNKLKAEQALLSQAFIRSETNETVETVLKQKVAEMGEKISIRRFVRYNLGEGLEKKTEDFAAEVAAQTEAMEAAPAVPEVPKVRRGSPHSTTSVAC
jgi:elongation factor Ts